MKENYIGLIFNLFALILFISFYLKSLNMYYFPLIFFLIITSVIIISEIKEYLNKTIFQTSLSIILIIMWIGILSNPTILNNNLILVESIIVSFSTFLIIIYFPRKWKKNIIILKPFKDELEINPNNIIALNNMGVELTYQRRFNQAIKCFNKVLELEPEDSAALYNKSILYAKKGNYRNMEHLNKALKIDPNLENAKKLGKLILEYYKEDFIKK